MFDLVLDIEFFILDFIYNLHTPFMDKLWVFITHLGDKGLLWILMGLIMCFTKKYRRAGTTVLLALLLDFLIANLTLKPLVARIRPYEYVEGIKLLIDKPMDFSFPSGHSFAAFAAANSVFLFHKKEGICLLVLASLIAFSRLYLYVHFPTDVICGVIFGIAVSFFAVRLKAQ